MQKTIVVCDNCEKDISSVKGIFNREYLMGARFDLCKECSTKMLEVRQQFDEEERKMFEQEKAILKSKLPKIFDSLEGEKK